MWAVGADASNGTRLHKPAGLAARQPFQSQTSCSSLGGHPRPPQSDVTAVLAAVKVVRPTGRSTLTAAAVAVLGSYGGHKQ
jgi:hypothetical protein